MKKKAAIIAIVFMLAFIVFTSPNFKIIGDDFSRLEAHNVNKDFNSVTESVYIPYTEVRANFNNNLSDFIYEKIIMIGNAEELYNWSQDLKYTSSLSTSVKNTLASHNYALGADIDYSIMKARRFMPIGYDFNYGGVNHKLAFSGNFDGRGFEINELELEIYSNFNVTENYVVTVFSTFFSMFTVNEGTITDVGLINPIIDLNNEHVNLRDFSYLVGNNKGTVKNSYVVDTRPYGQAGMRVSALKTEVTTQKRAAGLVHTNTGTIKNSFFSGISVINRDFMHVILEDPIYYFSSGANSVVSGVVYNNTRYMQGVPTDLYQAVSNGIGNTEEELISGNHSLEDGWNHYTEEEGSYAFPKRYGLSTNNGQYVINNAREFAIFTKLLTFNTTGLNGVGFSGQTYLINNDINLEDVSSEALIMSSNEFFGTLTGGENQAQISNIKLTKGLNIEDGYHLGMFYSLSGTVENLKLFNLEIYPTITENYSSQMFYVGGIAAKVNDGKISNITMKSKIDFSNEDFKIGAYIVGGVAGLASGIIEKIYIHSDSSISFGTKSYTSTDRVASNSYLGGVIGVNGSSKLSVYNVLNEGDVANINTSNLYVVNNNTANYYVGGIIGYVNNTSAIRHNLGLLTNNGQVKANSLVSGSSINTYLGGVIGYSGGNMYEFSDVFGKFTNNGEFVYENNSNKSLYVAGILNSSHNEAVEFVQLLNNNDLSSSQANTIVSPLINHLSNTKLTISQATSKGNLNYFSASSNGSQKQNVHGAIYTNSNSELQLNFVNVETNLTVNYNNNSSELNIAGVTLNSNANFLNIIYGGTIEVEVTGNNTSLIWVSGITKQLSANKVMRNSMNEGLMNVYAKTTNTTNSTVKNLYVGGLVNINEAGDLHLSSQSATMPIATKGIINSINRANITSYFKGYKGIDGRINTFAGGIATINKGSIQDVVNTGNIRFANITSGTASQFVTISSSENDAGKTNMYKTGVITGGIVSVVTSGSSRIYDSINNGNIVAQSYYYARSGGILGVVSPFDVSAGDVYGYTENNNAADSDHLKHSVISNGINYGNIYAITSVIGTYATGTLGSSSNLYQNTGSNYTWPTQTSPSINMQTRAGSSDRIAIHSAAGGIIGSGLSVLKRMINHGQVGATDAAGGIIGSLFVYSDQNWRSAGRGSTPVGVTIVNINTAINYGDIRAIKRHSSGSNNVYFDRIYNEIEDVVAEIIENFYDYNDDFINPTNPRNTAHANSIRLFPEHKRGIGGIIGRIQRGGNQNMITNYDGVEFYYGANLSNEEGSFDFIVNMNPNVDLIGRLDQNYNFSLSSTAFHFHDAIYYSAKVNDTTQAVFTGFLLNQNYTGYYVQGENVTVTETYSSRNYTYSVTGATITYNSSFFDSYLQKGQVMKSDSKNFTNSSVYSNNSSFSISAGRTQYTILDVPGGKFIASSATKTFGNAKAVPYITETPSSDSATYAYHEDFIMRDDETELTTGEKISSYIYYAAKDLLANRFQTIRPNGMYVLSTTAGSTYGSVLPKNFDVTKHKKISESAPNNLDYNNIGIEHLFNDISYDDLVDIYAKNLYQTKLNDKSALLEDDQYLAMKDNNIGTVFTNNNDNIDLENNIITFEIDLLTLGSQRSLFFTLTDALVPDMALISRPMIADENVEVFQAGLANFRNNNPGAVIMAGGTSGPMLSVNLPTNPVVGTSYEVGKFVSYSEAAVMDKTFTEDYNTLYTVYLKIKGSSTEKPTYSEISRDGGAFNSNFTNITFEDYFTIRFSDPSNVLPNGHVVDEYLKLYYKDSNNVEHLVLPNYYSINSIPKAGTTFDSTITFNNLLRNGEYILKGKTYNQQEEFSIEINYNHDRVHQIYEFSPYTSTYYDGLNADFAFGHSLDLSETFTTTTYEEKAYLARYNYKLPFLETFSTSSFFEIETVDITDITSTTTDSSYLTYKIDITLVDGTVFTRYITESKLAPTYYRNNVRIPAIIKDGYELEVAESYVTREAERTTFGLAYNINSSLYKQENFIFTSTPAMNITPISIGISAVVTNNRVNIIFDNTLEPGDYEVKIEFKKGNTFITAGYLIINKRAGTSAYLNNIKFSEFVPGIEYPLINAVNYNNTAINTAYELGVYYRGIDYNDSDVKNHKYYRIDGEVSGVPLNEYMPIDIVNYLPLGGKIQRKYYVNGVAYWTDLVDASSTEEQIIAALVTDFTVDQITGELQFDGEGNPILPYVEYRVVSETDVINNNHDNGVIYFMSVRDIKYSFLAVFTYKYFDGTNYHFIDDVQKFDNSLFILNIYNYNVTNNNVEVADDEIDTVPIFDNIKSIKSTMTQFYFVSINVTNDQYVYRLGTNFSGFYHFSLDTEKVYYIKEGTDTGEDLDLMSDKIPGKDGYFYYINSSPVTRTRYFTIIITDQTQTKDTWGLTDYSQN